MNTSRLRLALAQNGTVIALVVLLAVFAILSPQFRTPNNALLIVQQVAEVGVVALPLAFLVMSGAVDLSVGSVASLSAVIYAMVAVETGSFWLGVAAGLATGAVAGVINGVLVCYFKLNALVVTLGFLNVWGGLALFLTGGSTVSGLPQESRDVSRVALGPLTVPVLVLIAGGFVAWWILNRRPFGRQVLAVGGNARAARLMGLNVPRIQMMLFVVTSLGAATAGVLLANKLQAASPLVGSGLEFTALTVVLLGGVAFEGGAGRVTGVLAGLVFVGALRNGLIVLGVSQFLQTVFIGLTLVLAISLDKAIQRAVKGAWLGIVSQRPNDPPTGSEGSVPDPDARSSSYVRSP